jgi:thiosulfate dehydrogenase
MFVPVIVLSMAIVVLLWWHALDGSMQALAESKVLPFDRKASTRTRWIIYGVLSVIVVIMFVPRRAMEKLQLGDKTPPSVAARYTTDSLWFGPDTASIEGLEASLAERVRYGRELIRNTARYLGPNGSVAHQANGMNCQNCHVDAGMRPWGNNYGAVWSTYPKFRERSGTLESIAKRVNDCIERSLNGTAIDSNSNEMQAIHAYMQWVGTQVPVGKKPKGSGLAELRYMDRAADPVNGQAIYSAKCESCHQKDGAGLKATTSLTYQYPPLWGEHSYNIGAGLFRLSRFAGYVKNNMPQSATWEDPQLTDEEAWDVAAYVNSKPRPTRDLSKDWPNIAGKPVDHPFGPYADGFSEMQHKYGPFGPIAQAKANASKKNK